MNGDDLATLDEALAFIAFCDEGSHAADSITTSSAKVQDIQNPFTLEDIDHLLILSTKTQPPKHAFSSTELQSAPARKKKRVRSAASSSTVIQRRRKVELETLREETVKLEAYLTHLSTTQGQQKLLRLRKIVKYYQNGIVTPSFSTNNDISPNKLIETEGDDREAAEALKEATRSSIQAEGAYREDMAIVSAVERESN
ncbi:hypothetical protein GQ600_18763 [Phytophthora cactorum]|nr:hypothetical protein GQ600_18763 [Phytophthora cactorum]